MAISGGGEIISPIQLGILFITKGNNSLVLLLIQGINCSTNWGCTLSESVSSEISSIGMNPSASEEATGSSTGYSDREQLFQRLFPLNPKVGRNRRKSKIIVIDRITLQS